MIMNARSAREYYEILRYISETRSSEYRISGKKKIKVTKKSRFLAFKLGVFFRFSVTV